MNPKLPALLTAAGLLAASTLALSGCAGLRVRRLERSGETVTVGTYQLDTLVHAPPEKVFDFIANWAKIQRIADSAEFTKPAQDDILRLGEVMDGTFNFLGLRIPMSYAIIQRDRPRTLTLAAARSLRGWMITKLTPEGDGTRVHADLHLFFVPDNPMAVLGRTVLNSQSQSQRLTAHALTRLFKEMIGEIEGRDPKTVRLEHENLKRFVDAYFLVEEEFSLPPRELYPLLASAEGLNRVFAGHITFAPSADSAGAPFGTGSVFSAAAAMGSEKPLTYDAIVVQAETGKQFRMVVPSNDAFMEWDFILEPTRRGSKLIVLMITNYTESADAATFGTIMLTSQMDQWVREGLAGFPGRVQKAER